MLQTGSGYGLKITDIGGVGEFAKGQYDYNTSYAKFLEEQ